MKKLSKVTCPCGTEFQPANRNVKYCGTKCGYTYRRTGGKVLKPRTCICGTEFQPASSSIRHCSPACGIIGRDQNNANRKAELLEENGPQIQKTFRGDQGTLTYIGPEISTEKELLEHCKVDLDVWEVVEMNIGSYQGPMKIRTAGEGDTGYVNTYVKVNAKLKRKVKEIAIRQVADHVLKLIADHSPTTPTATWKPPRISDPIAFEPCIFDLHLGAEIRIDDTGQEYDRKAATRLMMSSLEMLFGQAQGLDIRKVYLPSGNDFFEFDNLARTTTKGTQLHNSQTWPALFAAGCELYIDAVEWIRSNICTDIELVFVPGNHDRQSVFGLGKVLEAWYRNDSQVTINNSVRPRKYARWGVNLIGWTHGDREKWNDLPMLMAHEAAKDFAVTQFREWHIGHKHTAKGRRVQLDYDEHTGVRIRVIPTVCPPSEWAHGLGYINTRSAEGFAWSKKSGPKRICQAPVKVA